MNNFTSEELETWKRVDEAQRRAVAAQREGQRPLPVDLPNGRSVAPRPPMMASEEGGEMPRRAMARPVAAGRIDFRRMLTLVAVLLLVYGVAAPIFLPSAAGLLGYFGGMAVVVATAVWLALRGRGNVR